MGSRVALAWSGGKDSALALWVLEQEHGLRPDVLLTTVTEPYQRISMHGVRRELLHRQAERIGIELVEVMIPAACSNAVYERRMAAAFATGPLREVAQVASGDLFLQDIRAYREERLRAAGREALFPLWKRDTGELARRFVDAGFRAVIVCVDPRKLDRAFAGREFDHALLDELPDAVDPCGENGEFHTFVYAGPVLAAAIEVTRGEVVERDGFSFCDLMSTDGGGKSTVPEGAR